MAAAKPLRELRQRFASRAADIDAAVVRTGRPAESLVYLPLVGRKLFWTVLLDPVSAEVLTFLPLDPF